MKIIDLSQTIYQGMEVYPGDPPVKIEVYHSHEENSWELRLLTMASHTGTHVDSFSHMHEGLATIDELPLERFFGPAQVVTPEGKWPQDQGLFFREELGLAYLERILASGAGFVGGQIELDLERALLGQGIITYTNLVNLELLPLGHTFTFLGLPLKIKGGDGSPVRAIAILDKKLFGT